jgi:hypothetical protein
MSQACKRLSESNYYFRCFLFFDICYMMTGIAMIVVGMTSEYYDRDRMLFLGGIFGTFASFSSACNW